MMMMRRMIAMVVMMYDLSGDDAKYEANDQMDSMTPLANQRQRGSHSTQGGSRRSLDNQN